MGTLAWDSEPKVGAPSSPRMWPEGRTSEDAKFCGCLYPPQVVVGAKGPQEDGTQPGLPLHTVPMIPP